MNAGFTLSIRTFCFLVDNDDGESLDVTVVRTRVRGVHCFSNNCRLVGKCEFRFSSPVKCKWSLYSGKKQEHNTIYPNKNIKPLKRTCRPSCL